MTILRRKRDEDEKKAESFIAGAPDAQERVAGIVKGNKRQISLTISPELLKGIDKMARQMGQTRAGLINMAVFQLLKRSEAVVEIRERPSEWGPT